MYRKRKTKGHSIAELGPALFLILLIMVLPLACLASLGIRYTLLFYAVRQAAREAAKSTQFQTNQSALQISAINRARQIMALFANSSGGNGLTVNPGDVHCYVDIINIASGATTSPGPDTRIPPATPISTAANVYNVRVQVDGTVRPLFEASGDGAGWFGVGVPGLSRPFPVRMVSAAMAERPDGLNK